MRDDEMMPAPPMRWSGVMRALEPLSRASTPAALIEGLRSCCRDIACSVGIGIIVPDGAQGRMIVDDANRDGSHGEGGSRQNIFWNLVKANGAAVGIADMALDPRLAGAFDRHGVARSMAIIPVGDDAPFGALIAYWAEAGHPTESEMMMLHIAAEAALTAQACATLRAGAPDIGRQDLGRQDLGHLDSGIPAIADTAAGTGMNGAAENAPPEQDILQTQKMDVIGRMAGTVAHDINNLLSPIMTSLDLILRMPASDQQAQDHARTAMRAVTSAQGLIRHLLTFARQTPIAPDVIDLESLFHEMMPLLNLSVGADVMIDLAAPADLPAIVADRQQLEVALLNLVVNARDAMPSGGRIVIGARQDGGDPAARDALGQSGPASQRRETDWPGKVGPAKDGTARDGTARDGTALDRKGAFVTLYVQDDGIGMDAKTRNRAIQPFFTTKGKQAGTGLGLSMVRDMAHQAGGAIRIDSEVNAGTRVSLTLPIAHDPAPHAQTTHGPTTHCSTIMPRKIADDDRADKERGHGKTACADKGVAFVIDDHALVRRGTAAMLREEGFSVVELDSAKACLAKLAEGITPDLIISDQVMPGMSGLDLAGRLKAAQSSVPFILLSGLENIGAAPSDVVRITKPFRHHELQACIAHAQQRIGMAISARSPAIRRVAG